MTEIVAVDIGGTHARFALAEVAAGRVVSLGPVTIFRTADHASLAAAWSAFAETLDGPLPRRAAIAIACPVGGKTLKLTNNPWTIRPAAIPETLGLDRHVLLNDFAAVAHAVAQADPADLRHIAGPDRALSADERIAIVGPGTGLGVASVLLRAGSYRIVPTEGGHIAFAPLDEVEDAILAYLRARHGRVSAERVVSGPGLDAIYAVLSGRPVASGDNRARWAAALAGTEAPAVAALDRFCLSLGSVAGDIALAQGASAVVVAGGLGLRLADRLPGSGFAERFVAKGRFSEMMAAIPVKLITHPQPGLYGAAAAFAQEHDA